MDPATWLFENNNNQQHQQTYHNDHHFLNFDSPSNNSDVSSLNHPTPNSHSGLIQQHTPTPILNQVANNNNQTPTHQNNGDDYQDYLNNSSSIDILESNLNQLNQNQDIQHQQQLNQQNQSNNIAKDGSDLSSWSNLPDLNDIDMNFFPNEQNLILNSQLDDQRQSHHLQQQQQHQQQLQQQQQQSLHHHHGHHNSISHESTPLPLPPPTPQFSDSFSASTNSSFLQSFQSPMVENTSAMSQPSSIRPDVVFTPLVSPAVTPMDALIKNNHQLSNSNGGFFSPLTSPALEAKSPMKLKKSSSPEESTTPGSTTSTHKKYSKRKTPGNTPIVGPTIPGRIAKQSPIIKAKRSSSYANNISHHQQQLNTFNENSNPNSNEKEIMAPPKPRRTRKQSSTKIPTTASTSNAQPATPATLMNFKMEKPNSNTSSPVILPSNGTPSTSSRRSSNSTILPRSSTSNSKSNDSDETDTESKQENSSKKTSHKIAEQGRRNRMNQAIQDLSTLIPDELATTVTIPSKATTVELASQYIKDLLGEIDHLKDRLNGDIMSNESISPLETTDR